MKKIGIVNGPNLDRLGTREPEIYGSETLKDLEARISEEAKALGVAPVFFQSNHEGALIDWIGKAAGSGISALIINPAALTHTSLALRDALAGCGLPAVEVHISNIHQREEIRRHSMTADACTGVISGLGFDGYIAALWFLTQG